MSNERETRYFDIAGMAFFGLLAIMAFIAGCCGYIHQFLISGINAIMFNIFYNDYKDIKTK